ncbi:hypothetical protein, variant [Exophiala mesophila]|uniref:Ubiquitin-like protease family profile domain-containing protein n=1 Tax=Exophiala mesophila TaxID=212818 RepID=A0A0D1WRX7_EXOME|nr:hypothetical protein, variant [Exophiala mesophila]KIV91930.1 hypothetical protein, variant [Exophiala mesophila]
MKNSWFKTVNDHYQNAISILTGKPTSSQPASPDDDNAHRRRRHQHHHSPPHSHLNASRSALLWAAMPSSTLPTSRYLTRRVTSFIDNHDSSERDPIALDSDEDPSQSPPRSRPTGLSTDKISRPPPSKRPERSLRRSSETRGESRLLGGYSRRGPDPNAFVIADPMKKQSFTSHWGIRPFNNLDAPRNAPRSARIFERTLGQREGQKSPGSSTNVGQPTFPILHRSAPQAHPQAHHPYLDLPSQQEKHDLPNKRRKLDHPNEKGSTSASPIALDEANLEDSSDELHVSPIQPKSNTHAPPESTSREVTTNSHNASRPLELPSPVTEREGDFTKGAAKRRKATGDAILETSSPDSTSVLSAKPPPISNQHFLKHPLFSQTTLATPEPTTQNNRSNRHNSASDRPIHSLGNRDLTSLIVEVPTNRRSSKFSDGFMGTRRNLSAQSLQFELEETVYPGLPSSDIFTVEIEPDERQFFLNTQDPRLGDDPVAGPFYFRKLAQIRRGPCPIVSFIFSRTQKHRGSAHELHLRFLSEKSARDFLTTLLELEVRASVIDKETEWLENSFQRAKSAVMEINGRPLNPDELEAEDRAAQTETPQATRIIAREKRPRIVDRLDAPAPQPKRLKTTPPKDNIEVSTSKSQNISEVDPRDKITQDARVERVQRRTTRAQDLREGSSRASPTPSNGTLLPYSKTGKLGKPWARDLVYPKPGKRSATVPFEDLSRLNDDEFLNDNLIMFFLQYLETHMERHNSELHKRTYFFNTYFFERLTKGTSHRQVNYESVSRWTKAIDLFNRDFVVVPVNENLHWYLAIICNLPQLRSPQPEVESEESPVILIEDAAADQPESTETETGRPPEVKSDLSPEIQEQLAHRESEARQSLAELTIRDQTPATTEVPEPAIKAGTGRKAKQQTRRSLPKYDADQPIIITLDSLGQGRYTTCHALKQYIVAEGKNKRNLEIDSTAIRGMTAKEIPTQNNFSDCGLYLCMYLEQFVADPHNFISRILQRNEDAQQWPKQIRSGSLRSRLRELILEVHRQQENEESEYEIPKVGDIMIERQAASDPTAKPYSKSEVQIAKERFDRIVDDLDEEGSVPAVQARGVLGKQVNPSSPKEIIFDPQDTERHGLSDTKSPQPSQHAAIMEHSDPDKSAARRNPFKVEDAMTGNKAAILHSHRQQPKRRPVHEIDPSAREIHTIGTRSGKLTHDSPSELVAHLRSSNRHENRTRKRNPLEEEEATKSAGRSAGLLVGIESYAEERGLLDSEVINQSPEDTAHVPIRRCRKKTPIWDDEPRSFEQEVGDSQEEAGGPTESVRDSGRRTLHFTRKKAPVDHPFGSQRRAPRQIEVIVDSQETSSDNEDNEMLLK